LFITSVNASPVEQFNGENELENDEINRELASLIILLIDARDGTLSDSLDASERFDTSVKNYLNFKQDSIIKHDLENHDKVHVVSRRIISPSEKKEAQLSF
jgi:hypothetical protein